MTVQETTSVGRTQAAWLEIERTVIKALLSGGVRRVEEAAITTDLWASSFHAALVWGAVLRSIEKGARSVWLDGSLVAEIASASTPERARAAVEWVRGAEEEADDAAVDALIRSLRDRRFCQKVHAGAVKLRETVENGNTDAATRAEQILLEMRDLAESRYDVRLAVDGIQIGAAFEQAIAEERARAARKEFLPILGIPTLDKNMRMEPGTCTVIGAESHLGKTGLMASAAYATARLGVGAVLISVEDPLGKISLRIGAEVARLSTRAMVSGELVDRDERIRVASRELMKLPCWGRKLDNRSLESVIAMVRWAATKGAKVVFVDYAQAIKMPGTQSTKDGATERFNEGLYALLAACAERKLHLVLLSQVKAEERQRKLRGYDLAESKKLMDAAANVVLFEHGTKRSGEKRRPVVGTIEKAKDVDDAYGTSVRLIRDDYGVLCEDGMGGKDGKDEWGGKG